ncbi:hypothetical protein Ddc_10083 [Ditylenchus destructor]|nr:hypothetical protein Ddc_10083 [Ditylenchus destructor]
MPGILVHFNQRMQSLQANMDAIFDQMEAISRKRQPMMEKIQILESKLGINELEKPKINMKLKPIRRDCHLVVGHRSSHQFNDLIATVASPPLIFGCPIRTNSVVQLFQDIHKHVCSPLPRHSLQ